MKFLARFSKNGQILNFNNIRSEGAEMLDADWRMDRETDRQTDKHEEAKSRSPQFYDRA